MKKTLVLVGCLIACAAMARTLRPAQLAPSSYADTEASTNVSCVLDLDALKQYQLSVELLATPSNNVVVATGCDADGDGALSFDERAIEFGWDCGDAFVRSRSGEFEPSVEGPDTNGVVKLTLDVAIKHHTANPRWLYDSAWNLMNITVRGVDAPEEHVSFKTTQMGTLILIR